MFPIPLKQGLFVELESSTDQGHAHYLSRILSLDISHLQVTYPRALTDQRVNIEVDTEFRAGIITEAGNYGFQTSVLQIQEEPEPSIFLTPPVEVYEWQRQYLRLDATVWVRYRTIPNLGSAGSRENSRRAFAMTANISGGGLLLKTDNELLVGTLLELEIDMPTVDEPILALGRVVHRRGGHGIEFVLIDGRDRDAIVRYIFNVVRRSHSSGTQSRVRIPEVEHEEHVE